MNDNSLTHINESGEAHMVDIGTKPITTRRAEARAYVDMSAECLAMITEGKHKKGDVFAVSRIAGIQAAKKCSDLIPLCHPLMLTKVEVTLTSETEKSRVRIDTRCEVNGQTGVEMEALTAASVAALTLYDMCKAVDKHMVISQTHVVQKSGGRSGDWQLKDDND